MNPDKLLTLLMGNCWHEPKDANNPFAKSPCIHCGKTLIHWPHGWFAEGESINPSYSDPRHRDEFFTWLCRERGEMWKAFWKWIWYNEQTPQMYDYELFAWIFFSSPSRPRDLMAEWLQLDSTIKRFGWEECPNCKDQPIKGYGVWFKTGICPVCNGSGKVFAPWAKYAKEGE